MLDEKDMLRAGVKKADKAVLFAPTQKTKGQGVQSVENEAMIDADTIFAFQGISDMNPACEVVTELVNYPNMAFLSPDMNKSHRKTSVNPLASPQYASGAVYTSSMLDTLVCQAFYNAHIVTVLQQLVAGSDVQTVKAWDRKWRSVRSINYVLYV